MLKHGVGYLGFGLIITLLAACSSPQPHVASSQPPLQAKYHVNRSLQAIGQNSRIRHIVLHYTSTDTPTALHLLTKTQVSSHYLIDDGTPPTLYQLVDESERAWHAGLSQWFAYQDLNTSSIGIEIVNTGRQENGEWQPYKPEQLTLLTALLADLIERYRITPENIVGHSDIAPQRKIDPGPLFPWADLAAQGIGRWYDPVRANEYSQHFSTDGLPSVQQIQHWLQQAGYQTPSHGAWDKESQNVLRAFQMRYRPQNYNGMADAESIGILKAVLNNPVK